MRPIPLLLLLAACAPDHFYVEGTQGWGEIDPDQKSGTYDTESQAITVGLTFPLQAPPERRGRCSYPEMPLPAAAPVAQPASSGGDGVDVPWTELLFLLSGVAGGDLSRRGYGKFKNRRKKTS